jgi:F-type H+-transporting ATPase subunit b
MLFDAGLDMIGSLPMVASGAITPDLTALFLVAVFLFLMIALNKLLYQPYLKVKDVRVKRIDGSRNAAVGMQKRAEDLLASYKAKMIAAHKDAESAHEEIRQIAKGEEQEILLAARQEVDALLQETRSQMATEVANVEADLHAQAVEVSTLIVEKVLPS